MTDACNRAGRLAFFGCPLDLLSHAEILGRAEHAFGGHGRLRIEGLNVAKLIDARSDPSLLAALCDAELVHVDGAGVQIGLRMLGIAPPPRRAGIDLMADLCRLAALRHRSVYLLGAREEVVQAAARRLAAGIPGLRIAGARNGYFTEGEEPEVADAIRRSGADLLFVGISSPKKERFMQAHWGQLGVALGMGVGGSFDVVSGVVRRAPRWMQQCGLEWAYRMAQEPGRLARRYVRTNLGFLWLLACARLRGNGIRSAAGRER